jgi:hypothetical protein
VTDLFTCWPPAPEDLAKLIRARPIGIVSMLSSDAHFLAAAYSASRSSSPAPVLWESLRTCLVDVLRARRDSVPRDLKAWRNMRVVGRKSRKRVQKDREALAVLRPIYTMRRHLFWSSKELIAFGFSSLTLECRWTPYPGASGPRLLDALHSVTQD